MSDKKNKEADEQVMEMDGVISVHIGNTKNGTPILELHADDLVGSQTLTRIECCLERARMIAVSVDKADIFDVCKVIRKKDSDLVEHLSIPLALGGIGYRYTARPTIRG